MSPVNISGIMSNLNTAEMIDALLTYDNQNVTLLQYDQAVKTNQISTYQAINAKLLAFQTQAAILTRESSFEATRVTVSDEDYLTAIAGDNVGVGSYTINIDALAQNHQIASQGFSESEAENLGTGTVAISVGDGSTTTITVDSTNNSLEGLKNAINTANASVTASIIDDGSSANSRRLLLTTNKSGAANEISVTVSLDGSKVPDFSSATFDSVETPYFSSQATSSPTLGTNASYTGNKNKTYTFTLGGSGEQTVGSGDITIIWTDGTKPGEIVVTSADTEIEVKKSGFDKGLTLQFSAGKLVAGDTFSVQTFAPLIQKAQDARISLGLTSGGGSPIVISSSSNLVKDLIPGVTLNLKKVTDSGPITINAERDTSQVENWINQFVSGFNDVVAAIDEQFKYDPEADEDAGILFGDRTLMMIQTSLRSRMTSLIEGLESDYKMLVDIGIRMGAAGRLAVIDRGKLQEAIVDDIDGVMKLFATSGESTHSRISFLAATDKTKVTSDGYEVLITQAATRGYRQGSAITDPGDTPLMIDSTNKNLVLKVDGIVSDTIALTEGTYNSFAELVEEIQQKINNDDKIGNRGIVVSYMDAGANGLITITSGSYGGGSKVEMGNAVTNNAFAVLGLADGKASTGHDVAGTINGEKAEGQGRILTGKKDNATTEGLKLDIKLTESDLATFTSATIKVMKGIAAIAKDFISSITRAVDGTMAWRTKALQNQIDDIEDQVEDLEERIDLKRQRLLAKFMDMEDILGKLDSQSSFLQAQLLNLSKNWNQITGNN